MTEEYAAPELHETLRAFSAIPQPKGHWFWGHLKQVEGTLFHRFFYQTAHKLGGVARIRFLFTTFVIFQKSETVQYMLKQRPERFQRADRIRSVLNEAGLDGVFTAEDQDWKSQRLLMNPAFKPSQLKIFYPQIQTITTRLLDRISQEQKNVDIQSVLMCYTTDITSSLAFGQEINTLQQIDHPLLQHLNVIFPNITRRLTIALPYWRWFKLKADRDLENSLAVVQTTVNEFIQQARQDIAARGASHVDQAKNLLEALILTTNDQGQGFSEAKIAANVLTLLLAGEDTTANTLAWAIDFLADRPELQDALSNEVDAFYSKHDHIELEQLTEFPLISALIHETLRLRPVATVLMLQPLQDEIIEGYAIPAGTRLIALLCGDGMNEQLFPKPDQFDIYRWVNMPESITKEYAQRLMPFGYGPRLCPGRQLSLVEMRLTLITLLKRFRIKRTANTAPATEVIKFTLQPVGLRVDFIERSGY